jgi:hypothetical protein
VDFGVIFLHGRDEGFLSALSEVPATALPGWPAEIRGAGRPCQPQAFAPGERRMAFVEGLAVFPKHLARGLDVRTEARVTGLAGTANGARVLLEGGETIDARTVVVAMAGEQSLRLLETWSDAPRGIAGARALLGMVPAEPCLCVIAMYPEGTPAPSWHAFYPEDSRVLQLVAHDSSKRRGAARLCLVYQAHARFSREREAEPGWAEAMLEEAGRLLGPWALAPAIVQAHRWKFARTNLGAELRAPLMIGLPAGGHIGLVGEVFSPGGGVEAAWLSGRALAQRILTEEKR